MSVESSLFVVRNPFIQVSQSLILKNSARSKAKFNFNLVAQNVEKVLTRLLEAIVINHACEHLSTLQSCEGS